MSEHWMMNASDRPLPQAATEPPSRLPTKRGNPWLRNEIKESIEANTDWWNEEPLGFMNDERLELILDCVMETLNECGIHEAY